MTNIDYPLLFVPVYKDYLWGGDRISRKYGRGDTCKPCAESWEIADRAEGMSIVANGRLAGRTLGALVKEFGSRLTGTDSKGGRFPLLVKIIDAHLRLSVQVHPADENAAELRGEAKSEMWYVLSANRGARVFAGFKPDVNRKILAAAIKRKKFSGILEPIRVKASDAIMVEGGVVHCIDAGSLLLEVQQNSNTTYRVYDWDRAGADGKKRPLHVAEAVRAIIWGGQGETKTQRRLVSRESGNTVWDVLECRHFHIERLDLSGPFQSCNNGSSFHAFFVVSGGVEIRTGRHSVRAQAGVSCLLPATVKKYALLPMDGTAKVLRISLGRRG
ncbi:MAG: type I phosphomannose isomerase catalytic subunit [bacterium]